MAYGTSVVVVVVSKRTSRTTTIDVSLDAMSALNASMMDAVGRWNCSGETAATAAVFAEAAEVEVGNVTDVTAAATDPNCSTKTLKSVVVWIDVVRWSPNSAEEEGRATVALDCNKKDPICSSDVGGGAAVERMDDGAAVALRTTNIKIPWSA